MSLEQGKFSSSHLLAGADIKDIIGVDLVGDAPITGSAADIANAMAAVEDESDVVAGKQALLEADAELAEFSEQAPLVTGDADGEEAENSAHPVAADKPPTAADEPEASPVDDDSEVDTAADNADTLLASLQSAQEEPTSSPAPALAGGVAPVAAKPSDRVQSAVRRMDVLASQLTAAERRCLTYRESVDPHPWVMPEVIAEVEESFVMEDQEWEIAQLEAIRVCCCFPACLSASE
jgi:hypothetical protein